MVVSEENIFEGFFPLLDEFAVGFDIKDRINENALSLGLKVVGEDSQFSSFELCNIETFALLFGGERQCGIHILFMIL